MGVSNSRMQEILSKQHDFQMESQRIQLERQAELENAMKERLLAIDAARSRDLAINFGAFAVLAAVGCTALTIWKKQRLYLLPILPPVFAAEYHYKIGFQDRLFDYRETAEELLESQRRLFESAGLRITFDEVESRRIQDHK